MNGWKAVLIGLLAAACVGATLALSPDVAVDSPEIPYPFEDRNMFFGLSLINPTKHASVVADLGISWLSLQPHVLWMAIEREPGVYSWSALDEEVRALQTLGL
ncbi:MAG: hypothetical protein WBC63_04690, partial [Candidatus Bipolaricaulia bacterium]